MSAPLTSDPLREYVPCAHDPIAEGHQRYRVTVMEWVSHVALIDAPSKEAAEDLGEQIWLSIGGDAFHFSDRGLDIVDAWPLEGGCA